MTTTTTTTVEDYWWPVSSYFGSSPFDFETMKVKMELYRTISTTLRYFNNRRPRGFPLKNFLGVEKIKGIDCGQGESQRV